MLRRTRRNWMDLSFSRRAETRFAFGFRSAGRTSCCLGNDPADRLAEATPGQPVSGLDLAEQEFPEARRQRRRRFVDRRAVADDRAIHRDVIRGRLGRDRRRRHTHVLRRRGTAPHPQRDPALETSCRIAALWESCTGLRDGYAFPASRRLARFFSRIA